MDKVQPKGYAAANDTVSNVVGDAKLNPTVQEPVPVFARTTEHQHLDQHAGSSIKAVPENKPLVITPKNPDLGTDRFRDFEVAGSAKFRFGYTFTPPAVPVNDLAILAEVLSTQELFLSLDDLPLNKGDLFIPQPTTTSVINVSDGTDVTLNSFVGAAVAIPDNKYTFQAFLTSPVIIDAEHTIDVEIVDGLIKSCTFPVKAFTSNKAYAEPRAVDLTVNPQSGQVIIANFTRDIYRLLFANAPNDFQRFEGYRIKKLLFTATDQANWLKADTGIFAYYLPDPARSGTFEFINFGNFYNSSPRQPYFKLIKGGTNLVFDVPVTDRMFYTKEVEAERRWNSPGWIGFAPMSFHGANFTYAFTIQADVEFYCPSVISPTTPPSRWYNLPIQLDGNFEVQQLNEYTPAYISEHGVFTPRKMTLQNVVPVDLEINNIPFKTMITRIEDTNSERRYYIPGLAEINISAEADEVYVDINLDTSVLVYSNGFPDGATKYNN